MWDRCKSSKVVADYMMLEDRSVSQHAEADGLSFDFGSRSMGLRDSADV
jgi:hypothetical protein